MEGMSRMFGRVATHVGVLVVFMCILGGPASLLAAELTVTDGAGLPISTGFRWLLQEDLMFDAQQGVPCGTTPPSQPCIPGTAVSGDIRATNFHKSYMPPVDKGDVASGGLTTITIPDPTKKYFVSVLPHCASVPENCYSINGGSIARGQTAITVVVPNQPVPTAQIYVGAYADLDPIDNSRGPHDPGLGGFTVTIYDAAGQVNTDVFGNALGTMYLPDGSVDLIGGGTITTITQAEINAGLNPYNLYAGDALIKNLAPGKYGVLVTPVAGTGWQQTSTVEGSKTIDAWVFAGGPRTSFELGPAWHHADFGFIKPFADATILNGSGSISGRIVNMHMSRPPDYTMHKGHPIPQCWVGLNTVTLGRKGIGLYAAPCNDDSTFTIPNMPAGTYQLVIWDQFLDDIFALIPVTVTAGQNLDLQDVGVFRWFGTTEHYVFFDTNGDGVRDVGEVGMWEQNVNLRYRDGSIYQTFPTDVDGFVPFDEVFPFFSWLIAEVDFARFKTTGVTVTVDGGGPVAPGQKLTPQIQADGAPTRTEPGPAVLLEGFQSYLGTLNQFEWGKTNYLTGENGGITGIVHYTTTRAEDDPAFAGAEDWEPGIPHVPVILYSKDTTLTAPPVPGDPNPSKILSVNGVAGIQLSDVDFYPFGWSEGGPMGPEDVKRNGAGAGTFDPGLTFNAGDAVQIVTTDSWDDNLPTGCPGNPADPFYQNGKCYDGIRNYNQIRPALFDGGYAFLDYVPTGLSSGARAALLVPGYYIVEAVAPKAYEHQSEESKNVDFGDASVVSSTLALPMPCVGDLHTVPAELTLFPGVPAPFAGLDRPLCDRKELLLTSGQNAATDFFMYTDVPVAAQVSGFVLNDLANEFDQLSPNFGEKSAPGWLPVSFRDWTGREVVRVYTDQMGTYNAMLPSTYTINAPTPTGVSPQMLNACINNPGPIKDPVTGQMVIDPFYNKHYGQICWSLQYMPGTTTYADTPVVQIAAFVGKGNVQTDCECADRTPRIFSVTTPNNAGPFIATGATGANRQLNITSLGTVQVPDPNAIRTEGNLSLTIARDFGFGSAGQVTLGGLTLPIVSWNNAEIIVTVPAAAVTGQLVVTRADSGLSTTNSVTVTVGNPVGNPGIPAVVRTVAPGESIQAQLDLANPGDLILVQPGSYYEMLIMTKPVNLQGFGAASTHIFPVQSLGAQMQAWREKMNVLVNCPLTQAGKITLLSTQPNLPPLASGPSTVPPCGFNVGSSLEYNFGLFLPDQGAGIFVGAQDGIFTSGQHGRIDGFSVTGSSMSPGIVVNSYARFLEISNNQVSNNEGMHGGGIRVGDPTLSGVSQTHRADGHNDHLWIHHNQIVQNGSLRAPGGGVALNDGSGSYRLTDNYICGNFAVEDGGGVAHYGFSPNSLIAGNKIIFNQTFVQQVAGLGGSGAGGGLLVSGLDEYGEQEPPRIDGVPEFPPSTLLLQNGPGSGSVTIVSNLIQGNNAGTSDGGGVMLQKINGSDVLQSPTNSSTYNEVLMVNNIIVNNVAGLAAGGIALQDAVKVTMINNTVAHNDSTATAGLAFQAGSPNQSTPQPAGIVSNHHSLLMCEAFGLAANCPLYSDPVMQNNIVLNNRSMFWQVTNGIGQLNPAGVQDLALLPAGSGLLNPRNGILTNTADYHASNQQVTNSASVFANSYFNAPPGFGFVQPDGRTILLEITTTLHTAAALDEGGNFIDVHYGPLSPAGNYHLTANSPAIDTGNDAVLPVSPLLATDYDGQPRPMDGNNDGIGRTDIGADEVLGPVIVPSVGSFRLRRADTDVVILDPLTNNATVDLFDLCNGVTCQVNIEAVPSGAAAIQSMSLVLSGATTASRTDNTSPYTIPGNTGGNFAGITINRGVNTIMATPYSLDNLGGTVGTPLTVNFTVVLAPVFTSIPPVTPVPTIGNLYVYNVNAQPLAAGLTFSLTQVPQANRGVMTIDPVTGIITWTPAIPNPNNPPLLSYSNQVTVRVTDAQGRFADQQFTIVVAPRTETIVVTQAIFNNPPGNGNTDASWTINGTSTVDATDCNGNPNVCGNLTIFRVRAGVQTVIGTATVQSGGTAWSFTELPASPAANQAAGDTIRVRSATGGLVNSTITFTTN